MKVFDSISAWQTARRELNNSCRVGFVPTMGALHAGHISLVEIAKRESDFTVASIFVNPTQFDNKTDLEKYPRNIAKDIELLSSASVDALILPNSNEIYADNYQFKVSETEISKILCGHYRPGHFDGVLTVVLKLINIVRPQSCYFGEKDFQQYLLIKKMSEALFVDTNIVACPIVRETSGLAMSSRNERLNADARNKAALIYKSLIEFKNKPSAAVKNLLTENGFKVDYVEDHWGRRFVAAHIDEVRLIDNVKI
jgi:pantoate--beta-alanine ligase